MATFSWQQVGDEFHAETRYGTAIIAEHDGVFTWRIEQSERGIAMRSDTVSSSPPYLDTFDDAERYVLMNLAFLTEPPTVDPNNPQEWLADFQNGSAGQRLSLDLGEQALPADTDPTFFVRLRLIRAILYEDGTDGSYRVGTVTAQDLDEAPQWIKVGDEWHAPTRFGRAVIVEHRKEPNPWIIGQQLSRYTTRIEHPTGAVLPCGLGREPQDFPTFEEAHDYILLQLDDLANWPDTDATSLGNAEANYPLLEFTLAVCASALSVKADPIHRERFEHIKSDLFLRLD